LREAKEMVEWCDENISLGSQGRRQGAKSFKARLWARQPPRVLVMQHHNYDAVWRGDCAVIVLIFPKSVLIGIGRDCVVEFESMMHQP